MRSSGDFPSNDSVTVWKSLPFSTILFPNLQELPTDYGKIHVACVQCRLSCWHLTMSAPPLFLLLFFFCFP